MIKKVQESSRLYGNNRIKIPSHYKFQHCMYQIINNFNKTNDNIKMCGNVWIEKDAERRSSTDLERM